jgi:hypothetical protein
VHGLPLSHVPCDMVPLSHVPCDMVPLSHVPVTWCPFHMYHVTWCPFHMFLSHGTCDMVSRTFFVGGLFTQTYLRHLYMSYLYDIHSGYQPISNILVLLWLITGHCSAVPAACNPTTCDHTCSTRYWARPGGFGTLLSPGACTTSCNLWLGRCLMSPAVHF